MLSCLLDIANSVKLVIADGGRFVRRFLELRFPLSRGLNVFLGNFIVDKNGVGIHS